MSRAEITLLGSLALGIAPFAVAFGIGSVAAGLPPATALLFSAVVYAGASQFAAIGVLATGGSSLLALMTVGLVNLRFLPVGLAVPRAVAPTWPRRLLAAHLLIDPSLAVVHATRPDRRALMYWVFGIAMYILWVAGTAIGVVAGNVIPDPSILGLDAALPCAFIAILASWWRDAPTRRATTGGATITLLGLAFGSPAVAVPAGVLGAAFGLPLRGPRIRGPSSAAGSGHQERRDGAGPGAEPPT